MKIRVLLVLLVLALGTISLVSPSSASAPGVARVQRYMTTPCLQDEVVIPCFWDAEEGNGTGHSFYVLRIGRHLCVKYWEPRYDRRHGGCTS